MKSNIVGLGKIEASDLVWGRLTERQLQPTESRISADERPDYCHDN
jgi:hypothetical protein